jgi:hypothetical protein
VAFAWKQKSMFLEARYKLALFVFLLYVSTACSPITAAQDPIRVETNQVLVPVVVIDRERKRLWDLDPRNLNQAVLDGDTHLAERILDSTVVQGLAPADFQVFEDDKPQEIQSVTYQRSLYWNLRDNQGHHTEFAGPGGGRWSTAEWPPGWLFDGMQSYYVLSYSPPESPEGSCHQIKVKVHRRDVFVAARSEYCNVKHAASDPVKATPLGDRMENAVFAAKTDKLSMSLVASELYTKEGPSRVHVTLEWPWNSLHDGLRTKSVLGMVFAKDGSLATRFSDLSDRSGIPDRIAYRENYNSEFLTDILVTESRYERQLALFPGEYSIRVVLSDGTIFGRVEMPLSVEGHDGRELAISPISICKQIVDISGFSPHRANETPGASAIQRFADYEPLVSNDIEFKPTGNTRFKKGGTLYTYFEIYEPSTEGQSPAAVQFQMRIVDLKTGEVKSDSQPISATPYMNAGSSIIPVGRGMDISKLPIGSYRLDVRATDSTGKSTAWRSANFTVHS